MAVAVRAVREPDKAVAVHAHALEDKVEVARDGPKEREPRTQRDRVDCKHEPVDKALLRKLGREVAAAEEPDVAPGLGAQAREQTAAATRRLVRRQESWFRPDPRITWFAMDDPEAGWRDAVNFVTTTV